MGTWHARTTVNAEPHDVLGVLTDPEACGRWSPIPFDVEGGGARLATGTTTRVKGRLAGYGVAFDIHVTEAEPERLALTATGPVELGVEYRLAATGGATEVQASVSVRPRRGIRSAVMSRA